MSSFLGCKTNEPVTDPPKCVIHHPGFELNCLNPHTLQNIHNIYRAVYGPFEVQNRRSVCLWHFMTYYQGDRDLRPVSFSRGRQWTSFTTTLFTPTGGIGNCMSKINEIFVIALSFREEETWNQCHSVKGDSGHLSQPLYFFYNN